MSHQNDPEFEGIKNVLDAATWQLNLETNELEVNERWFSMLGLDPNDFSNVNLDVWKDLIHPKDLEDTLSRLDLVIQGKSDTLNLTYRMRHNSGGWKLILNKGQIIKRDTNNNPLLLSGEKIDISNLKESFSSLYNSSNQYKSLIENIPGAFYQGVSDEDWRMFLIGEDIELMTGYHCADFTSQKVPFVEIIHPDDKEYVRMLIINAIKSNERWEVEYRVFHKNGKIVWLFERGRATGERLNSHDLIEGFIMDITDKKRAEMALVRTTELLDKTNEVAMVGGWEVDFNSNQVHWSRVTKIIHEVENDFECTIEEALNFYKPGRDFDNFKKKIEEAINNGIPFDKELEIVTAKGSEKWVRVTANPDVKERKFMKWHGSIQDVTKRKKDSLKILRQNEFRELVAYISSKFVKSTVQDMKYIMEDVLERCINYFGIDRCFVFQIASEGCSISNTYDYRREGIPNMQYRIQKRSLTDFPWFADLLSKKEVFTVKDVDSLPDEALHEKTEWKEQQIKSILFIRFDINNEPAGVIGLASHTKLVSWCLDDISDLKVISNIVSDALSRYQLELSLIKEKLKAEKASNAKSEFLANMSHEIRTPLNAILGFSEILYNKSEIETVKKKLDIILNSGRSLLTLINDLLDFSKIESGNVILQPEMLDLEFLLNRVEQLFSVQARKNNNDFRILYYTKIPERVFVDQFRLQQILINLTSNAIKFTKNGSVKITVTFKGNTTEDQEDAELIFEIEDSGIGISETNLDMVFESFHQADHMISRDFGGTGLGLAISKQLVELMNGKISAKSELGKGSTFMVQIPITQYIQDLEIQDGLIFQKQEIFFESGKVLVIDDVEINNELIRAYLDEHKVEVYTCNSGVEGVRLAEAILPDVILLDLRMPGMSGRETAAVIKSLDACKQTPIIAFSASSSTKETAENDFSGNLSKPIEERELLEELKKFLPYIES